MQTMQREQRLRRAGDFATVYRRGRSWANQLVVLKAVPREREPNRYGFAVGKRVGKAVVRNRVRRRLRAIVRQLPASSGWDIIIVARGAAAAASFAQLRRAVEDLFRRARLAVSVVQRPAPPGVEQ